jgi:hypothetical protein
VRHWPLVISITPAGQRRPVLLYRAGVGASLGDLRVLSTSRAGNSDRPNYLAVCDNREAAIDRVAPRRPSVRMPMPP